MNVVTVEDPIEYRLPGIVQVQVHERAGLTFGAALRSIMRQDPDVILVGEIRDRETAEIAIQASLTGHLVLSTLHTNDAASAVTRLIDIGVARYKIATAVKGVVAQRLVRRRCRACEGAGCAACAGTRLSRAAWRSPRSSSRSPEFERRVAAGASTEAIAEAARLDGCASLWESGTGARATGRHDHGGAVPRGRGPRARGQRPALGVVTLGRCGSGGWRTGRQRGGRAGDR